MKSARFVPAARREFLAEILYYNQEQAGILIFAVAHQSRRPGYWETRVQDR